MNGSLFFIFLTFKDIDDATHFHGYSCRQAIKGLKQFFLLFGSKLLYFETNINDFLGERMPMSKTNNPQETPLTDPARWVDVYGDFLFQFAMTRISDKKVAEDLVQETFLSALKARESFAGKSSKRTWFITILKNKIIDYYRRAEHQVMQKSPMTDDGDEDYTDFQQEGEWQGFWRKESAPRDWGEHPETALDQKEFMKILRECIGTLPKRLAAAFTLRELDEMDTGEICKQLDISSSNLWVILHRARNQLRRCLEMNWFGPHPEKA
ncbi:MAG: sigma-70 family RNA polymerase sigma factor [Caldithrix sp.]|nr:sigma-70 family RNA polymerase sigma factor [Caldithrix sp.]